MIRDVTVRPEKPADGPAIFRVHRLAFGGPAEAMLVDRLRLEPEFVAELSLVAEVAGHVVGHILFSPITILHETERFAALALAPVAVEPDFQRQRIGAALVREGLEVCCRLGHRIVIVLGHPAYYPRFGFVPANQYGISAPFDVPAEAFMACELVPNALAGVRGTVCYPHAFDDV